MTPAAMPGPEITKPEAFPDATDHPITGAQSDLHSLLMQAPVAIVIFSGPDYIIELVNDLYLPIAGKRREELLHKPAFEVMPAAASQGFIQLLDAIRASGEPFKLHEHETLIERAGQLDITYLNIVYQPIKESDGAVKRIMILVTDVTEQVAARTKTEESEAQLRIAIESGELGTFDFYPQTGVLLWSDRTKALFGLPPGAEVTYNTYLKGLHPDDKERSDAASQQAMNAKNGGLYENEYRTIGITDGKLRWLRSKGKISFDAEGRPIRFTGVTQDITHQKETLRSLQLQSLVLERMDEGVSVSDLNGVILLTNAAEDKMFGYEPGELLGKHVTVQNAYPPEDNERIVAGVIAELKQNGFWNGEWHNRKKDGASFYTFSFITQLEIDDTTLFVCVQRDITEEKKAREVLAYHTALLEAQNEAIPDAILIVDTKGKMLSFNRHFVALWKIPEDIIERQDDAAALQFAMTQLTDPQGFIDRVNYCYQHPEQKAHEEVLFKDGRIIERYGNSVIGEGGTSYGWAWYFRDVTEQKRAEKGLKLAKEQLELTFRNTPAAIYLFGKRGEILFANLNGAQLMGYETVEELLSENDLSLIKKKTSDKFDVLTEFREPFPLDKSPTSITLQSGKPAEAIFLFIRKQDKTETWVLTKASPLLDDKGELAMVLTTSTNITLQKTSERAIRQSEERFRTLAEALPQLVWTTDAAGVQEFASKRWEEYTGLDPKGLDTWQQMIHPADINRLTHLWIDCLQTGKTYKGEVRLKNKKDEYRWHLVHGEPLRDEAGTITKWVGAFADIHEQQLAEEAVKQSSESFRQLADMVPQLIWTARPDGFLDYFNKRWYEFTGFEEGFGDQSWIPILHPDDVKLCIDTWYHSVQTGKPYSIEYRFKDRVSGAYRWFLGKALPIRNKEGAVTKWFGSCTDIHDQRAMTEKLEQLVALRTRELQRSNDDLQQFAHVASHDLKEPVRKIRTFGSRLSFEFGDALPEKANMYIEKIEAAATRMYAMIDGVLNYSTVSTAEQLLETIDLTEIIRHIESDLEVVIQQKGAVIQYQNLPFIDGSAILIYQLFYNLVNNALKFAKAGEAPFVQISATAMSGAAAAQEWGMNRAVNYTQILIQDNGIGFSQDQAIKIFKTFTRLNAKDKYEGTGLGLALCKKIVERHQGAISAAGMEGTGAIFKIVLPLQQLKKEE